MSKYTVVNGPVILMGMLTLELGVVLRLGDCLPSRALALLFPPIGGMVASSGGDGEYRNKVTEVWFYTTRCDWRIGGLIMAFDMSRCSIFSTAVE